MKKLLLTLIAVIAVGSASAQFKLTADGFVNASNPDKSYIVMNMPGKNQKEIFDHVVKFYMDNYRPYTHSAIASCKNYCHLKFSMNEFTQNKCVKVFKGKTNNDNVFVNSYVMRFQMKDGKLRVNIPELRRMIEYKKNKSSYLLLSTAWKKSRNLFKPDGTPSKGQAENIRGIEDYFNGMVNSIATYSQDSDW